MFNDVQILLYFWGLGYCCIVSTRPIYKIYMSLYILFCLNLSLLNDNMICVIVNLIRLLQEFIVSVNTPSFSSFYNLSRAQVSSELPLFPNLFIGIKNKIAFISILNLSSWSNQRHQQITLLRPLQIQLFLGYLGQLSSEPTVFTFHAIQIKLNCNHPYFLNHPAEP